MWVWDQSAGCLMRNGVVVSHGYAGRGRGKNNPALQNVPAVGPIPRGRWTIEAPYDSKNTGPFTLVLSPCLGTDCLGRSAFRIHGDSIKAPGTASRGCIILPRKIRELIWASKDRDLEVIA